MGHFQCQIGMQKGCTEIKPAAVGRTDGKGVGMDFQAVRLGIGREFDTKRQRSGLES